MTDSILAPIATLALPDAGLITTRAQRALDFVRDFTISTPEDYGLAAEELQAIKSRANKIDEQRTGITGPINKALKAINDLFRGPAEFLAEAERTLKTKMLAYDQEQARIAAEARRKAEEAAAAERARLAAEAQKRSDELAAQQLAAEKARAEGNDAVAAIAQAEAHRAQSELASLTAAAQMTTVAAQVAEPVKAKGISKTKKIDFEVVSLHDLVKHIAAHPELIGLLTADSVKLRAYVKGLGMACQLPGVRVTETEVMSARASA